jgi:BirA family biotin operon repressor/biotin-[acetyl-CoA-carboxylase] ligase
MDVARQEAQKGAAAGTVILAGEQTRGRGRVGRTWLTPPGNIALSVILRPDITHLPYLIMLASLALVGSIEKVTGLKTQVKWPNDVLIRGEKVAGILIENELRGGRVAYAIIGIGINVSLGPGDKAAIPAATTSLNEVVGREISRIAVVRQLLMEMERWYLTLTDGESIYQAWRGRLVTLGKRVSVASGESQLEGIAESVDKSGALMLRQSDGSLVKIVAGDIRVGER